MSDRQTEGLRFAEIVTGLTVTDEAPPEGSPLARLIELDHQRRAEGHSQEWLNEQARKL
ncbi:hypothetical protein [Saccharomonospora cyanea]|uniref:Uncharacterized protein n=1 Tax=Saccharomonospora cyanea NA-134 TaxID=882082 RepID=H5XQD5_9PSEU|nr:hypothetical protein [Saccharomonospora cyanea]EHR63868.1 hypothetical protein SaccyDRAFT_5074 [Saccharomonospora cyanea NA-134]